MRSEIKTSGFTLIELMVAVAIAAILAAIAYPSYLSQVRKGHRSAAQSLMMNLAQLQQQYLLDARNYAVGTTALAALSVTLPAEVAPYYTVTVTPSAPALPPVYTITAAPIPGSMQAADGALTLDQSGNKTLAGNSGW